MLGKQSEDKARVTKLITRIDAYSRGIMEAHSTSPISYETRRNLSASSQSTQAGRMGQREEEGTKLSTDEVLEQPKRQLTRKYKCKRRNNGMQP